MLKNLGARKISMALAAVVVAATGLTLAATARGSGEVPQSVAGVWYGTTYLGDPNDPNTSKLQFAMALHADRTVLVTASDHTGQHPFFEGLTTPGQGTWERNQSQIFIKFFEFSNGGDPPATFGIIRVTGVVTLNDEGKLVGMAGVDVVSCPDGAEGCVSPNDTPFPEPNMFPFEMEALE
jgi:hypothetical protein